MSSDFETILNSMRVAAAALRDAGIRYALAGSVAIYGRGGPDTDHDVDFLLKPEDADRALEALEQAGFRTEKPPEGWLYKAYGEDGEMVDLIFRPASGPVDDALLERAEELEVFAIHMPVLTVTDVLATKLLALREHELDLAPVLEIARAPRAGRLGRAPPADGVVALRESVLHSGRGARAKRSAEAPRTRATPQACVAHRPRAGGRVRA